MNEKLKKRLIDDAIFMGIFGGAYVVNAVINLDDVLLDGVYGWVFLEGFLLCAFLLFPFRFFIQDLKEYWRERVEREP